MSLILTNALTTLISTALAIWMVTCLWIIFKKAWRQWWESIIPVWNLYVFFKIAWKTSYFWVLILLPIIWLIHIVLMWFSAGNESLFMISSLFSWILWICTFLLPLIAWLELPYWITKKFWKSNLFYIWMLFLTPIFMWILAFSNEKYEKRELEKEYSYKKWLLISIGVALILAICDAAVTYYKYKAFSDYFENEEYTELYMEDDEYFKMKNISFNKDENLNNTCYDMDGNINKNPKTDENWEIINCFNKNWKLEWKWINYNQNWTIYSETNYKNWEMNWRLAFYDREWRITMESYFENDEEIPGTYKEFKYEEEIAENNTTTNEDETTNENKTIKEENNETEEEPQEIRVNYDDIKKEWVWYKPTNVEWIDNIAKDYKWNIIMGKDFVDETKDWFYTVYTEITKRTLYIDDEYGFVIKIGPEKIGYTMEVYYNDINEPAKITFKYKWEKVMYELYIYNWEDCRYINWNDWEAERVNNDRIFIRDRGSMGEGIELITPIRDYDEQRQLQENHNCTCWRC